MKALIFGAGGQLGRALRDASGDVQLVALGRGECDLRDPASVERSIEAAAPQVLINAAAFTAVDDAESRQAEALAVNGTAVAHMARAARRVGARFVHVSTDFVFDGQSGRPYAPSDAPHPLNVYGDTKLRGEIAALEAHPQALIVRTSWLYAGSGRNFASTMLRLLADREEVRVVSDQVGTPTYAAGLASALWHLAATDETGILHFSDSGVASWYDFALAIQEEALALGKLARQARVVPITAEEFGSRTRRPSFSVLDKRRTWRLLGAIAPHWRVNLRKMLREPRHDG